MKIAVIGMGYVGLVTAISLAEVGNEIIAIEKNSTKLEKLKLGISPIYEPNIQEYLKKYNDFITKISLFYQIKKSLWILELFKKILGKYAKLMISMLHFIH